MMQLGKRIFGNSVALCSLIDKNGNTWLGSYDKGLLRWNKGKNEIEGMGYKYHGLPSNVIFGLLEDGSGNLWISTANGLAMWDPLSEQFTTYSQKDGLMNNEFTTNSYFKADDGEMYFRG